MHDLRFSACKKLRLRAKIPEKVIKTDENEHKHYLFLLCRKQAKRVQWSILSFIIYVFVVSRRKTQVRFREIWLTQIATWVHFSYFHKNRQYFSRKSRIVPARINSYCKYLIPGQKMVISHSRYIIMLYKIRSCLRFAEKQEKNSLLPADRKILR